MSKLRIVQFLRIGFIGVVIALVISEFNRCGGGTINESYDDNSNLDDAYSDRKNKDRINRDKSDDDSVNAEHVFDGGDSEQGGAMVPLRVKEQTGISDKIDFIFVIDSSKGNIGNIAHPKIRDQLGSLPDKLSEQGFDWQMYFLNSYYNEKQTQHNGVLFNLESNGAIIPVTHLNPKNLETVYLHHSAKEIFIDTIEHSSTQSSQGHCKFPPYCFKYKYSRPLSALNSFIKRSIDVLRPGADVIVVILTNKDEYPKMVKWRPFKGHITKPITTASNVINSFEGLFPDKNIYSINIVLPPDSSAECLQYNQRISGGFFKKAEVVNGLPYVTEGRVLSICPDTPQSYTTSIMRFIEERREETPLT